jgi:hypothetical protein
VAAAVLPRPQPAAPPRPATAHQGNEDRDIKARQDAEYEAMLAEQHEREAAEDRRMQERARSDQMQQFILNQLQQDFEELGPEPSDGISVRIQLPSGRAINRKFPITSDGNDVYVVAAHAIWREFGTPPLTFELRSVNMVLQRDVTLEEQGFVQNTRFIVDCD